MPSLSPADKRCVVSYLHTMDLDRKGHIAFRQLMRYMTRAPGLGAAAPHTYSSQGGGSSTSYAPSAPPEVKRSLSRMSSVRAVPGRDINASVDGGRTPWILRELVVGREMYLLDVRSDRVYSNVMGADWPELVGTWDGVEINFHEASAASEWGWPPHELISATGYHTFSPSRLPLRIPGLIPRSMFCWRLRMPRPSPLCSQPVPVSGQLPQGGQGPLQGAV